MNYNYSNIYQIQHNQYKETPKVGERNPNKYTGKQDPPISGEIQIIDLLVSSTSQPKLTILDVYI